MNTDHSDVLPSPTPDARFKASTVSAWRLVTIIVFTAVTLYYVAVSLHWRIMVDSSVMHTVVFLMRHGRAPYRQISDNNMPGAYFVEAFGMQLFGLSDLGWRLFEFSVLAILTAALLDIARRWDIYSGIYAAALFIAVHSAEGPQYAAERELTSTMLLIVACALLFRAVEGNRLWLLLFFGLATGLAASIKPTCLPFAFGAFAVGATVLFRRGKALWPAFCFVLIGLLTVGAADLEFLIYFHALAAFQFILQHVIPAYVSIGTPLPVSKLLLNGLPKLVYPLAFVLPVLIAANNKREGRWTWQEWTLLMGAAFGFASYLVQRKGYLHHRYTFEVFLFSLVGIEIFRGLRASGRTRYLALASLLLTLFVVVPRTLRSTVKAVGHSDLELALEGDLRTLGGPQRLQERIQCFDLVYGCLDALYHLRIVENASFTGDLLFFPHRASEATDYYRERFWSGVQRDPPEVIVVTNQNLQDINSFEKTQRWPAFAAWLGQNYTKVLERHFTYEHFGGRFVLPVPATEQDAYRVYVRDGSKLLPKAVVASHNRYAGQS